MRNITPGKWAPATDERLTDTKQQQNTLFRFRFSVNFLTLVILLYANKAFKKIRQ